MSAVKNPDEIVIIDDDIGVGQSISTKFEKSNETTLKRNLENVVEQSNAQKSDPVNSNSDNQKEDFARLAHTFTVMLGALYGMSPENVKKMMESEKGLITEFHNAIETMSKLFRESSTDNKEISHVSEKSRKENLPQETSSGIRLGDNWELPIIVLDSDDDDDDENGTRVIEIDSDEDEIQEVKKMTSLDDDDCIEIGKEEFNKARKGDSEVTDDYDDTDSEFIPIVPGEGSSTSKKRRRAPIDQLIREKLARKKIEVTTIDNNEPSKWRKDLYQLPFIKNHVLRAWATGFLCYRNEWERLEYLGDKVLMFCVLRFATAKYLRFYEPSDIKVVTTFLVSNKLLAAYSLTLGLDKQNQMPGDRITKIVADAFEAYIGAYYLSEGEVETTRYLEKLMSPLFELVLSNIKDGREPQKVMKVIAAYFHMPFLTRLPRLK